MCLIDCFYHGLLFNRKWSTRLFHWQMSRIVQHLSHVSVVVELPGFCICGLSRGQLQTNISKNLRLFSRFQQQNWLIGSRVLSDSGSSLTFSHFHLTLCSSFQFDAFLAWLTASEVRTANLLLLQLVPKVSGINGASGSSCNRSNLKAPNKPSGILPHL